jgi:signal transduction histidine kinase
MVLATLRLAPPLDHIEIQAVAADADELRRTTQVRWRMRAWGLFLLAGAVLAGIGALLRESAAQVEAAQSRGDFLIGVSHDLRTPLASVRLLAESLYEGRVESAERRRRFLGVMIRECERLHQLVERVLFFVKYGQDASGFKPVPVRPDELARSAADVFMARFRVYGESAGGVGNRLPTRRWAVRIPRPPGRSFRSRHQAPCPMYWSIAPP